MFDMVQSVYKKNRNLQNNSKNYLLRGFLFCEECGHAISISTKKDGRAYISCSHYQKYSKFKVCTPHTMNYFLLEEMVLKDVREMCKKYVKSTNFETILKNSSKRNKLKENLLGQINACKLEKEKLSNRKKQIYFDKADEVITLEEYREFSNQPVNEMIKQDEILKELEKQLGIVENKITPNDEYQEIVKEYLKMRKPNKRLLSYIIDKIIINQNKEITIKYNIKNPQEMLEEIYAKKTAKNGNVIDGN